MGTCPCCSGRLLRHVRATGVYWFCSYCRQEMPDLDCAVPSDRPVGYLAAQQSRHLAIAQMVKVS